MPYMEPERDIHPSHPPLFVSRSPLQRFLLANAAHARAKPLTAPVPGLTLGAQGPDGQPETSDSLKVTQPKLEDHA